MKVITLLGSPRKKGNTSTALGWFEKALKTRGHNTERLNVVDFEVKGCLDVASAKR